MALKSMVARDGMEEVTSVSSRICRRLLATPPCPNLTNPMADDMATLTNSMIKEHIHMSQVLAWISIAAMANLELEMMIRPVDELDFTLCADWLVRKCIYLSTGSSLFTGGKSETCSNGN
jgi:hypothetical protein